MSHVPYLETRLRALVLVPLLAALLASCESSPSSSSSPALSAKPSARPPDATSQRAAPAKAPTGEPRFVHPEIPKPSPIPAPSDVAAPPAGATKTASGLASKVLSPGKGTAHPKEDDIVRVHYTGWTKAGEMFDSSVTTGQPISFPVNRVIKGWTEGLQLMVEGEKRRLWIPAALAYGDKPEMGAPAGDLVFDVELLSFKPAPKPPPTPSDVRAPPKDAKNTESGLAYRVLKKGPGGPHPTPTNTVTVHYTGWTTDGKMFDSSIPTAEPASFELGRVIKGWTEGVQLMSVGDRVRFWIPSELAYGDKPKRPGAPAGMLVFDIELLDIK